MIGKLGELSATATILAFGVAMIAVFGLAFGIGRAVGPDVDISEHTPHPDTSQTVHPDGHTTNHGG